MNRTPLILASASPRRCELLRHMGLSFETIPSPLPEVLHDHLSPHELCQLNAYRKARSVAKQYPDYQVLGADTLVCVDHQLLGKPTSFEDACRMLTLLQSRSHQVITGVCLLHLRSHRQCTFVESTKVTFHPLDASQIRRYLEKINPLDKAGAYAIQEHGEMIIQQINGSFSNVVGLPVERLLPLLASWGPGETAEKAFDML
jgi:septum formation protein